MIICICQNVSERDIAKAVSQGCHTFAALQEQLEIGQCCGTCLCSARDSFATQKAACQATCGHAANVGMTPATAAI